MGKINQSILLLALSVMIFSSCRRSLDTGWDTRFLAPMVEGELTIADLVPDSLTVIENDESITLVYQTDLLDYDLTEEAIEIPDTSVKFFVSLDSLVLEDETISVPISLGQICEGLGIYGLYIIAANGTSIPVDPLTGLTVPPYPIDATTLFETATFKHGYLKIQIANGLPIDLTDVKFKLTNEDDDALIVEHTFTLIPAVGVPVDTVIDLTGMTVDGHMNVEIESFSTPGSVDPVLIDTSDFIQVTMSAYDMELQEAIAIFPDQNLVNNANDVVYDMNGPEFTSMTIDTGYVVIYVANTIEDTIHIDYKLPYAIDEFGNSVHIVTTVPPGTEASPTIVDTPYPINGYTIDLRGSNGNSVNTFYQEFSAAIHYTGVPVYISLDDSITVIYGLENIKPSELHGYLGLYDIAIADTTAGIDVFGQFTDGVVDFGEMQVDLEIENGMGAGGNVIVNSLGARNTETGEVVMLDCPTVIGVPTSINRAVENPYVPGYTTISLNTDNSNIDKLLEIFPDQLFYDVVIHVNPNGNEYNYQDFVINTSKLNIGLNLNMPLAFFASNLTLEDEFDVSVDASSGTDGIGDIDLALYAENTFPLEAIIEIKFKDDFGNVLDSIDFNGQGIAAAVLSDDCRVHEETDTEIHQIVDGALKDAIINSTKAVITIKFNTASIPTCSDIVKIYSDYKMSFQLVGDVNYTFSTSDF